MHHRQIPNAQVADTDMSTGANQASPHPSLATAFTRPSNTSSLIPSAPIPAFTRAPTSPARFASTPDAFKLAASPTSSSSSSSRDFGHLSAFANAVGPKKTIDISPPSAGTVHTRRARRPSMLSLAHGASFMGGDEGVSPKTAMPAEGLNGARDLPSGHGSLQHGPVGAGVNPPLGQTRSMTNPFAPQSNSPSTTAVSGRNGQAAPIWGVTNTATPFLTSSLIRRTSSAPPLALEELRTGTPPLATGSALGREADEEDMEFDDNDSGTRDNIVPNLPPAPESPLRWIPNHLSQSAASRRKGKARLDETNPDIDLSASNDSDSQSSNPPFTGRPLHASLLATLISESAPLEHEMRSEARLQRLLSSHPSALPLTPRAPRSSRGRFPETAGDDDDDDNDISRSWSRRTWLGRRTSDSDSDSDDMPMVLEEANESEVNLAFAAGMDMDRPGSSSSNGNGFGANSRSGSTGSGQGMGAGTVPRPGSAQGHATGQWGARTAAQMSFGAAGAGMVPSPGTGIALPSAFGGLGMGGGQGVGTPLASPTIERLELAGSPGGMSVTSPGMMQYRESTGGSATVRPGKRKAQDDRFDPYKRPRGSSPSLLSSASPGLAMSPSRTTPSMPIPQSPSHAPMYSSQLSSSAQNNIFRGGNRYPRPMPRSRSRAASPALSIGSTSGVLSTSLGNNGGGRPSFSLGPGFIPTGPGSAGLVVGQNGQQVGGLGGLGLLSLSARERVEEGDESGGGEGGDDGPGGMEMLREDSGMSRDAMEED